MYDLNISHQAARSLKKLERSGVFNKNAFRITLKYLRSGRPLPSQYKDHQLKGSFARFREYHLAFDLLVIYECDTDRRIVKIINVGKHDTLFR